MVILKVALQIGIIRGAFYQAPVPLAGVRLDHATRLDLAADTEVWCDGESPSPADVKAL